MGLLILLIGPNIIRSRNAAPAGQPATGGTREDPRPAHAVLDSRPDGPSDQQHGHRDRYRRLRVGDHHLRHLHLAVVAGDPPAGWAHRAAGGPDPRDVRGHAPALDLDRAVPAVPVHGLQRSAAFRLRNHGNSPAFFTRWVRRWDFASGPPEPLAPEAGDGVSWCIFPGGTGGCPFGLNNHTPPPSLSSRHW